MAKVAKAESKDIFLSYGRDEGVKEFVVKLKRGLEAAGFHVWLDTCDIPSGSEWPQVIGLALLECKALIAVVRKKYVSSQYCKGELYVACSNKKHIFPIIYEDGWKESADGAGVNYMIAAYNWAMFRPGQDKYSLSLQKLIDGLRSKINLYQGNYCSMPW